MTRFSLTCVFIVVPVFFFFSCIPHKTHNSGGRKYNSRPSNILSYLICSAKVLTRGWPNNRSLVKCGKEMEGIRREDRNSAEGGVRRPFSGSKYTGGRASSNWKDSPSHALRNNRTHNTEYTRVYLVSFFSSAKLRIIAENKRSCSFLIEK